MPSSTRPGLLVSTAPGCVVKDLKIVEKGVNYEGRVKSSEVGGAKISKQYIKRFFKKYNFQHDFTSCQRT